MDKFSKGLATYCARNQESIWYWEFLKEYSFYRGGIEWPVLWITVKDWVDEWGDEDA